MKNVSIKNGLLCLAAGATLASCAKKEGPQLTSKLSYQFKVTTAISPLSTAAHASGITTLSTSSSQASITWQSGYASVSAISLDGDNGSMADKNEEDDFIEPAAFKVDLFNGKALLGDIDIATGSYQNVEVKLELKQTSADSALYLSGLYNSSAGVATPVILSLDGKNEDFEILLKAKDLTISSNQNYIEFLDMHLDMLLSGVTNADLDTASLTNGAIIINSTSNTAIYNKVLANVNNFCDGQSE